MKRFYNLVTAGQSADGLTILLDGKPVRTPAKNLLIVQSSRLADALIGEWAAQKDEIKPEEMRLTQIVSTKIDRISKERAAMSAKLLEYLDTDLVCYRAPQPPELAKRQVKAWDLWLNWFSGKFGSLKTTTGLEALAQPQAARTAVQKHIEGLDHDHFTVLQIATPMTGSLVLGLAFIEGKIGAFDIFRAARVEEDYKAALYNEALHGPDPAQEKKDAAAQADLDAAEKFLMLVRN